MASTVETEIMEGEPVLGEMVRRLVEVYSPLRIYLFGSKARGDDGPDSDYDLLVVLPDDAPQPLRDGGLGYRALLGLGVAKDVLVCTKTYFDSRQHLRASLPATVTHE